MLEKDEIIEYMSAVERARYESIKAISTCIKQVAIILMLCLTLIACVYMYFVVPVEEATLSADNGSQIVESSSIGRDNINGR